MGGGGGLTARRKRKSSLLRPSPLFFLEVGRKKGGGVTAGQYGKHICDYYTLNIAILPYPCGLIFSHIDLLLLIRTTAHARGLIGQ